VRARKHGRGVMEGARGGVSSKLDGGGTQARLGKRRRGGVGQGVQAWGAVADDGGLSHLGFRDPDANIITRCARTKSHTYDESWYRNECYNFTI
jgi:hypothetical protein